MIVTTFVVLRVVSGVQTLVYGVSVGVIGSAMPAIVARFVVAAALWLGWLRRPLRA